MGTTESAKTRGSRKKTRGIPLKDLPGAESQVFQSTDEANAFPSGNQVADDPTVHPPFNFSPDNNPSKQTHPQQVVGWGVDLDPSSRPAYPKERIPPRDIGVHWTQPAPQEITHEIFHSVERAGVTPIFGTSSPPRGISGRIRRAAYLTSENDLRHWLMLMFADRVDVVEGIVSDLGHGHVPNLWKEMGLGAELKHNPMRMARRAATFAAIIGFGIYLTRRYRQRAMRSKRSSERRFPTRSERLSAMNRRSSRRRNDLDSTKINDAIVDVWVDE